MEFGAAIIATGAVESKPTEYLYGEHPAVETQHTLEERIIAGDPKLRRSRTPYSFSALGPGVTSGPIVRRYAVPARSAWRNDFEEINPNVKTYIMYRDLRTYGLLEKYYTESRRAGTIFVRYNPEDKPRVEAAGDRVKVVVQIRCWTGYHHLLRIS